MNNNRGLLNIGMIILLTIFIVIFYSQQTPNEKTENLSSLSLDDIKHIKINRPQSNDITFVKDANNIWHMTNPFQLKAHSFRINTLLSLTQVTVDKRYDMSSLDLSQYSLDVPLASITFNNTEIRFGKNNPLSHKRYFLAENKMSLLADTIYPLVSAQPSSFVDLSLLPDNFKITKISTPVASVFLGDDDLWKNIAIADKLNADQIQSLLQHWRSTQAFAVHKYLPRKQLGKIEISSPTETLIFHITDDEPWLILALPELKIEYHLDGSQKNYLYGIIEIEQNDA